MYCMQSCDVNKTLYGIPLEPLPDPVLFDDCGAEDCGNFTDPVHGAGCLFDEFDPDIFNKPCCKSGCCAICNRIGDDAPYLVPHIIACMEPWAYAASTCVGQGHGRCRNHRVNLLIGLLPTCKCMPIIGVFPANGGATQEYCDETPLSTLCCIRPVAPADVASAVRGYEVMCIRVRGVPKMEFVEYGLANPAFYNDPNGYTLTVRPTLYLEVLLKDCCGYMYTVKTSYRFPNTMLLVFPLRCRLCDLGDANIYLKTKIQLCGGTNIIRPDRSEERRFDFTVNMAVDACIVKHIPYDTCGVTNSCLPSLVNGAHNISDPQDVYALDAPYLVPFPIACRRIRSERVLDETEWGTPVYRCVNRSITLPPFNQWPGVGPWKIISVSSTGQTGVTFDDCVVPTPPQTIAECNATHDIPCMTEAECNAKLLENCHSHTLEAQLNVSLVVQVEDSLGNTYTITASFPQALNINLGTEWANICRAWLYVKTKFSLCEDTRVVAGGGTGVPVVLSLPVDMLLEACVMKLIPYQITGKDTRCNLGPWYYTDYCKYPIAPVVPLSASPAPSGASQPSVQTPEEDTSFVSQPAQADARPAPARPIRDIIPAGCRKARRLAVR